MTEKSSGMMDIYTDEGKSIKVDVDERKIYSLGIIQVFMQIYLQNS